MNPSNTFSKESYSEFVQKNLHFVPRSKFELKLLRGLVSRKYMTTKTADTEAYSNQPTVNESIQMIQRSQILDKSSRSLVGHSEWLSVNSKNEVLDDSLVYYLHSINQTPLWDW